MGEALALARRMQGRVWPNPPVGCVIVRDGEIVGRGWTQFGGRPHAERVALEEAGNRAHGASLYVTLEPCCHWGRTPPCADAIVAAGVKRVYASLRDPDPRVDGNGFRKLRAAGISVKTGLGADEACTIMAGFFHRIATGRPLVANGEHASYPCTIPQGVIPEGFDALIRSDDNRIWMIAHGPRADLATDYIEPPGTPEELLDALGARGLTSVYVPADDSLSKAFAAIRPAREAS